MLTDKMAWNQQFWGKCCLIWGGRYKMAESTCRGHEALSLKQMIILKVVELKVCCEDTNTKPRPGMKTDTENERKLPEPEILLSSPCQWVWPTMYTAKTSREYICSSCARRGVIKSVYLISYMLPHAPTPTSGQLSSDNGLKPFSSHTHS